MLLRRRQLRDNGSFAINRRDIGRRRHPEEDRILEYFEGSLRASTRLAAQQLSIRDHSVVWRTLHRHQWHPFHFQRVQGLMPADFGPLVQFSQWYLEQQAILLIQISPNQFFSQTRHISLVMEFSSFTTTMFGTKTTFT